MSKKKKIIIAITIAIVVISLTTVILFKVFNKESQNENQNYITRTEWIEMLCAEMGIEDYESDYGTYSEGNDFATGEFVALSAMKIICEEKMQIYLNTDKEITDDIYLDTALELSLINESELDEYCEPVVAGEIVKKLKNMYYNEFWPDDYSVIDYNESVVEITDENVLKFDKNGSSVDVTTEMLDNISEGSIIVFEDSNTGMKYARKVVHKNESGTVELSDDVKLEEVLESLVVSDIDELTFEDIVEYYDVEETNTKKDTLTYGNIDSYIETTKKFSNEIKSKGYEISLSKDDDSNKLVVEIVDNATGKASEINTNVKIDEDANCSLEIDIEEIYIGAQAKYTLFGGLEYVDVTVGAVSTITGTIAAFETEKTIPLFKTPVPLGNGIIGVDVEISLVIAADGSISFVAEIPVEASISYEKGKSIKKPAYDIDVEDPHFEGNCSASASLRLEPTLVILSCVDVVDVQAEMGITASAELRNQPNMQICGDIKVACPIFTVSVCGDEDADTLLGALGVSKEWEIVTAEKAPKKMDMHFEMLPGGELQMVDKCTYTEDESSVEVAGTVGKEDESEEETTEEETTQENNTSNASKEEYDLKVLYKIYYDIMDSLSEEAIMKECSKGISQTNLSKILASDTRLGKALIEKIGKQEPALEAEFNKNANIVVEIVRKNGNITVQVSAMNGERITTSKELKDKDGNLVNMTAPASIKFKREDVKDIEYKIRENVEEEKESVTINSNANKETSSKDEQSSDNEEKETTVNNEDDKNDAEIEYEVYGNGGKIVRQGDWIYYNMGKGLYKMKIDNTERTSLVANPDIGSIWIEGDWIYYSFYKRNEEWGTYKIRTDGTQQTLVIQKETISAINDGYIYFNADDGFMKMKLDGSDTQILLSNIAGPILFEGEWIYYETWPDEGVCDVYKVKKDGTSSTYLGRGTSDFYKFDENAIYYLGYNMIKKVNKDGSGVEIIDISEGEYYGVPANGTEYFISEGDICCMVGGNKKIIVDVNYVPMTDTEWPSEEQKNSIEAKIYMVDDQYIYFKEEKPYYDEILSWYRVKLDGTGKTVME